jgi:hypothetical protein
VLQAATQTWTNASQSVAHPGSLIYDLATTARPYARHGVPEHWNVDSFAESIAIHASCDGRCVALTGDGIVCSRVVPGLAVDVRVLFAAAETCRT